MPSEYIYMKATHQNYANNVHCADRQFNENYQKYRIFSTYRISFFSNRLSDSKLIDKYKIKEAFELF